MRVGSDERWQSGRVLEWDTGRVGQWDSGTMASGGRAKGAAATASAAFPAAAFCNGQNTAVSFNVSKNRKKITKSSIVVKA